MGLSLEWMWNTERHRAGKGGPGLSTAGAAWMCFYHMGPSTSF